MYQPVCTGEYSDECKSPVQQSTRLLYGPNPAFSPAELTLPKVRAIIRVVEQLESNRPFPEILQMIFNSFRPYIPYIHIGVALLDDEGEMIQVAYGFTDPRYPNLARKLSGYRTRLKDTSLEQVLQSGQPRVLNDLPQYLKGRPLKWYNRQLLESGVRSSITFPLFHNHLPLGIVFFSSDRTYSYTADHLRFLRLLANSLMLSLEKTLLMDDMIVGTSFAMAALTAERDDSTGGHLKRMRLYSRWIAELLAQQEPYIDQLDYDYVRRIERFSPLHDIGKVAIPDRILLKPGKLTPEEFSIMKEHTTYGAQVLRKADESIRKKGHSVYRVGIEIAQSHHERWDGTGYPQGLSGKAIPLSARIVAVADVFDALTSERVYKKAYDFHTSVHMILQGGGHQFDPSIVRVVTANIGALQQLYQKCRHIGSGMD